MHVYVVLTYFVCMYFYMYVCMYVCLNTTKFLLAIVIVMGFPADLDGNLKFENVRAIDGLIEEQRRKFLKAIEVEHADAVKYMDTAVYLVSSVL